MDEKLSDSDIRMIQYYWEKGDLERWSQWEEKLPLIRKQFPELTDAQERLNIVQRTIDAIVKSICYD